MILNTCKHQYFRTQCLGRIIYAQRSNLCPYTVTTRNINMADSSDKYDVVHDKVNHEFYIKVGNDKAHLQYGIINTETGDVDLFHTEVPPSFRGKGVAKILAKEALDHFALKEKVNFKLTCSYLQKFANENKCKEYDDHTIN